MKATFRFYSIALAPLVLLILIAIPAHQSFNYTFTHHPQLVGIQALLIIAAIAALLYRVNKKLGQWQGAEAQHIGTWGPTLATALAASVMVALSFALFFKVNGLPLSFKTNGWTPTLGGLCLSLLAPVLEEMTMRAGIQRLLMPRFNALSSIMITAAIFSLIHLLNLILGDQMNVLQLVGVFLAGVLMGLLYFKYGVLSAITFHFVWNTLQNVGRGLFDIKSNSITAFEGAPGTILILSLAVLILAGQNLRSRNRKGLSAVPA